LKNAHPKSIAYFASDPHLSRTRRPIAI
jgi:hypothetical protein